LFLLFDPEPMTSLRVLTILLLLWTGGLLWASDAPKTNGGGSATSPGRVVILGDSITAGYGLEDPAQQAYPALLQQKIDAAGLPFTIVNAGVSGDTTAGGLRRVDWVLRPGAAVLVVALGANDGLRGIPPRQTAESLAAIIRRARARVTGIAVIVAGMQMPESMGQEFAEQFKAVFSRVAMENDAALIPFLLEGVGGVAALNQPDRIHPTAEGQKRVAANVWAVLQKVLEARQVTGGDVPSGQRIQRGPHGPTAADGDHGGKRIDLTRGRKKSQCFQKIRAGLTVELVASSGAVMVAA
jgi:acyl-CoA thioesterase-1